MRAESQRRVWIVATMVGAGAAVMMAELAAGRLLARVYGQSVYTWTAVIGLTLAGLALGNAVGGRWADRREPFALLRGALAAASFLTLAMLPTHRWLEGMVGSWFVSWPTRIFLHALMLIPLAVLLGAAPPIAVRAALEGESRPGQRVGRLYAWNALGSIAGTYAAGFAIIPALGTRTTLLSAALLVAALAAAGPAAGRVVRAWLVVPFAALLIAHWPVMAGVAAGLGFREAPDPRVVYFDESAYAAITVRQFETPEHRGIYLDKMMHSEMDLRDPTRLLYKYAWIYEAVLDRFYPAPQPVSAFVIGGGGYTFPQYLALTRPGSRVEVAEIDPAVTRAARAACGLRPDTPLRIYHADARNVVADLVRQKQRDGQWAPYDIVLGDSFNDYAVPYHLTTLEFARDLAELMSPRGIYMLNLIDRFDSGRFLAAVIATLRQVFPGVYAYYAHRNLAIRGTYVVVAAKTPFASEDLDAIRNSLATRPDFFGFPLDADRLEELFARVRPAPLTDDYAPVETLLADVVRRDFPEGLDLRLLALGLSDAARGRLARAMRRFEQALEVNPSNVDALYNLGVAHMRRGEHLQAYEAFRQVLEAQPNHHDARNNAGVVLVQLGQLEAAAEQFRELLRQDPESVDVRVNLAVVCAQQGQLEEARRLLVEALELQPEHTTARENLRLISP